MTDYTGTDNLEVMADAINYNRFLLDLVRGYIRKGRCVLDFGAGIGTFAKALALEGYDVSCVEPDALQAERIVATGLSVCRAMSDIDTASVVDIYTFNVLEHIEDDVAALRECYRGMKRGGRLLIYVPAFPVLYSSMDRKVGHYRRYTRAELESKLRQAGFVVRKTRYADSLGYFASLLFLAIGNDSGDMNHTALVLYDRVIFPVSRILDFFLGRLFGKNVVAYAEKE